MELVMNFKLSPLTYALATLLVYPTLTYANDNTTLEVNGLDTIEVVAQGNWLQEANKEKVFQHAGARTIIERERLDESAVTTIKDALKQIPGVQVQENNGTGASDLSLNIGVRGLPARLSYRSTVLFDGIPLSFAPYGQPQLSLAPLSMGNIESIDVVRGAGSVRFGPQNVGGIINFNTRSIPDEFKGSVGITTEFAKNGHIKYNPNVFVGTTLNNGLGLALLYSGTRGEGYRDDRNKTTIDDVMLKTSYAFSDINKLYFNAHHYNAEGEMPNGLTVQEYNANPFQATHFRDKFNGRRTDFSLRYTHQSERNNAEILAYYINTHRNSLIEHVNANGFQARTSPRDYKVFAIEPRFSHSYNLGKFNGEVTVGYRYLEEESSELAEYSQRYTQGSDYQLLPYSTNDGRVKAHAAYIDNRFDFGKWSVTPGVRFEYVDNKNTMTAYAWQRDGAYVNHVSPHVTSKEFLPNLAILYKANDQWNIFANAGVSFGPQQNSHLARITSNRAEETTNNIQPEKSKNYEIGTKYKNDALSAELTLFYLDFDKELALIRDGSANNNSAIWTNLGATSHKGLELGLQYDLSYLHDTLTGLSAYANYTYTDAKHEAGDFVGKDLSFYSRHVANAGLRYVYDQWGFNLDAHARSKQYSPYLGTTYVTEEQANGQRGNIPGYTTVSTRLSYDFGDKVNGLKVAGGVKNIFDKTYFTRSTDNNGGKFVGQPRTFFLQASYDF